MLFLKFIFFFAISFLILSFPISDQTIFGHLNRAVSPFTQKVFKEAKIYLHKSSKWSKKLFTNSAPAEKKALPKQNSTEKKNVEREIEIKSAEESYTAEERALLKKVLQQK